MKLATSGISKKTLVLIVTVALLGALAGVGGTYLAMKEEKGDTPKRASDDGKVVAPTAIALETTIPEGTISASVVGHDYGKFKDQEVKLRGRLVETGDKTYVLAGQELKDAASVKVDFSQAKIDPSQYVSAFTDPNKKLPTQEGTESPKNIGAVTVTGVVKVDLSDAKVVVSSISF